MANKFIGIKLSYGTITTYFNPSTGTPVGNFDHFSFVPVIPALSSSSKIIALQAFAISIDGTVLNGNLPLSSTDDDGPGHTRPANPQVNFSILNVYHEQLKVLYPAGSTLNSELTLYPHNNIGSTNFMSYKITTDNNFSKLIEKEMNPSPPKNVQRTF